MACTHLKQLYQLCEQHGLHFGGPDLIRIVCSECGLEETCPSMLRDAAKQEGPMELPEATPVSKSQSK